jgi:hypothetical protein
MILYHVSNEQIDVLKPQIGKGRHDGEDPEVVDKPAVWLSSHILYYIPPRKYLYEVLMEEDDPDLEVDNPFAGTMDDMGRMFGSDDKVILYFVKKEVPIYRVREWNDGSNKYEPE